MLIRVPKTLALLEEQLIRLHGQLAPGARVVAGAMVKHLPRAAGDLLEKYLGMPYEAALAFTFIAGLGYMLPALLGVPLVPGWITPAIPVVILFLNGYEPGPDAIKALFALQIEVTLIFLILGVTGWGSKLVQVIPNSLKSGIIIGAVLARSTSP